MTIPDKESKISFIDDDNSQLYLGNEDLELFMSVFKEKLVLSSDLKRQFAMVSRLQETPEERIQCLHINLPHPKRAKLSNKTLILDLDNTLVNVESSDEPYTKKSDEINILYADYISPLDLRTVYLKIYVRPYAIEMLRQLTLYYEIIIFTAANEIYADAILDVLDPKKELIDHRFYRQNCVLQNGFFIKDLRIFNREFSSMIIVDDKISSFANQLSNGVPISPFIGTKNDMELGNLWLFLRQIVFSDDVRVPIAANFNLKLLYDVYKKSNRYT